MCSPSKGIDLPSQFHEALIRRGVCWKVLVRDGEEFSQGNVEVAKHLGTGTELETRRDATSIGLHGVGPGVLKAGAQLHLDHGMTP